MYVRNSFAVFICVEPLDVERSIYLYLNNGTLRIAVRVRNKYSVYTEKMALYTLIGPYFSVVRGGVGLDHSGCGLFFSCADLFLVHPLSPKGEKYNTHESCPLGQYLGDNAQAASHLCLWCGIHTLVSCADQTLLGFQHALSAQVRN